MALPLPLDQHLLNHYKAKSPQFQVPSFTRYPSLLERARQSPFRSFISVFLPTQTSIIALKSHVEGFLHMFRLRVCVFLKRKQQKTAETWESKAKICLWFSTPVPTLRKTMTNSKSSIDSCGQSARQNNIILCGIILRGETFKARRRCDEGLLVWGTVENGMRKVCLLSVLKEQRVSSTALSPLCAVHNIHLLHRSSKDLESLAAHLG